MAFHCELTSLDIHVINTWTYANSATREAATGFTSDDVYKVAVQTDDNSVWLLVDHSPITWQEIGAAGVSQAYVDAQDAATLASAESYSDAASANALTQALAADPIDNSYDNNASEGQSTTTSSTYQQKVRLSVSSLPLGNYILQWYAEGRNQNVGDAIEMRIQEDDSTTHAEVRFYTGDSGGTNWLDDFQPFSGHRLLESFSGSHDFDIDYRSISGGTAEFRRARITLWRIS